jgi:hypothetical protein
MKGYILRASSEWIILTPHYVAQGDLIQQIVASQQSLTPEMFVSEELQAQCRDQPPDYRLVLRYDAKYQQQPKKGLMWDVIQCGSMGVFNFVSERVMLLLKPHVQHECDFLPMTFDGIKGQYYGMWIRNIVDAMDEEHSVMHNYKREYQPHLKDYWMPVFYSEMIQDRYLFRIPGHKYASLYDFATERFLKLVTELGIYGFEFYDGAPAYSDSVAIIPNEPKKKTKSTKSIINE